MTLLPLSAGSARAQCPDGTPPPCGRPSAPPPRNSVAVLTFRTLSGDSSDTYLAEGLSDLISTRLQQASRLVVKSRPLVRAQEARRSPVSGFGAAYVLSGSILRTAGRLQVTAELARSMSGDVAWSDRYNREAGDALTVEADIAGNVARVILGGRLRASERTALAMRPTGSQAAYDHFIRGNVLLAQRTARAVAQAAGEYEAAVQLDSGFTAAIGRVAYAYGVFLVWGWNHPTHSRERLLAAGLAASDVALRRDSTTSDAWMARGYLLSVRNPLTLEGVPAVFERAIQLDPRNAEAHHQYGAVLRLAGRDSEAVRELRRALELEPGRPITQLLLAEVAAAGRRLPEAEELLDSAVSSGTGFPYVYLMRARTRSLRGNHVGARADAAAGLRRSSGADSVRSEIVTAFVAARAGDTLAARSMTGSLDSALGSDRPLDVQTGTFLAMAYTASGDGERALQSLERCAPHAARLWFYLRWPEFDAIRSSPRFARLVAESRPPTALDP